jgi:divalent metal cation (Fe/Co/Zn/Cd) transporter
LIPTDRLLLRRGVRLEYATLGWNVVGVVVVSIAAIAARSVALAGFGLDSLIEIFASVVVVWELTGTTSPVREQRALRMIGTAFFALAAYVAAQGAWVIVAGDHPHTSGLGIAWTGITCVAMLTLADGKARTGRALGNAVLVTESRVTLVDAYLAGAVLIGLILNAAAGAWWADPLAGFVIVFYGLKEGHAAWTTRSS